MNHLKRISVCLLALLLLVSSAYAEISTEETLIASVLPGAESLKKQSLKSKYITCESLEVPNEVVAAWKAKNGFVIKTLVHYGADFYEDPTMEVYVGLDKGGLITGVAIGETVDHTAQFLETVTQDYLDETFNGNLASYTLTADAVSSATFSSGAVLYGVQAASWYAANVFRVGERDAQDIQLKKLASVVPGTYEKIEIDPEFTTDTGVIQYAAKGTDEAGRSFIALVAQATFTPDNPENNMGMPTYQIWFDDADRTVFAARMLAGQFYEGFAMDENRLETYMGIAVNTGEEFDSFTEGLITDAPEYIITSPTQTYNDATTGATPQGNDTSLSVRNCFITAARYYAKMVG